jgi:carbonic anhydrase
MTRKKIDKCRCCESGLEKYEKTHFAEAMVLSCIDYRFIDNTIFFLEQNPVLSQKYDLTTLAGASLGYNQDKFKCWKNTFIELVELAIQLHHIKQLIVFDHMDCGAYQLLYPDIELNTEEERLLHIKNIKQFIHDIKKIFPKLIYSGYLTHVDGHIETIVAPTC